ncbi:Calx-beta domain-containing protein, partial [Chloroflexota bacterium]
MGGGGRDWLGDYHLAAVYCRALTAAEVAQNYNAEFTPAPTLAITKIADPSGLIYPGDSITYTIFVTNSGTVTVTNVLISDSLPANTNFVTGSISLDPPGVGTVGSAPPTLASDLTITAGQQVTVTFVVTVDTAAAPASVITNMVVVTSSETLSSTTAVVTNTVASADLSISKRDNPDPVNANGALTYTLSITNAGPNTAQNVMVTDTLPPGVSFGSATGIGWSCSHLGGVVTCTAASLAVGITSNITLNVTAPVTSGVISNTAIVTTTIDPDAMTNTATETTTVTGLADLELRKTVTPGIVVPGQPLTYTVIYTNNGPGVANNIVITDVMPIPTVTNVSFVSSGGQITPSGSFSYVWQVEDLAPDTGGIITITGIVSPGLITDTGFSNTASITTSTAEFSPGDNNDTVSTTVTMPRVSFDRATYIVGLPLFTVTLSTAPAVTTTVNYTSSDGTAIAGIDYVAASNILTFAPGNTILTFTVFITDDGLVESPETFLLGLNSPGGAVLDTPDTAVVVIIDTDTSEASIVRQDDGGEPGDDGHFIISLSNPVTRAVVVSYTVGGSAT